MEYMDHNLHSFNPQAPLAKCPHLGQSNHPDDNSSLVRHDQANVDSRGSRLLDQHIYSQLMLNQHCAGAQDDQPHHHHPSEPRFGNPQYDHHLGVHSGNSTGATSSTLARQHLQLGLASPNSNNLNAPRSKNKRTRNSCGLAEHTSRI
ncbi:hypothetical protein VP01_1672g1 [Puccinia sorghi]|uniref:Uncharacterized protein n=1 Tax=Puccinia sorghi TaxID=27349 RepID=A0A0L6VGM6_9BASI|nr:hypothetical protein VP01_1672g1 [Puccinia sorghi]